jgi:hypothetical protein
MAITVSNIDELSVANVQQQQEYISQMLQEEHPTLDVKRGVFHDLVLYYSAVFAEMNQENMDRLRRSMSLLEIENDPDLAEDDIVDAVLSNYRVEREEGTEAVGQITIIVSELAPVTIPSGAVFTADGKSFETVVPYAAVISAANVGSDTDRVLNPTDDGNYSFAVEVIAQDEGVDGLIRKDTTMVPDFGILNYVKSYAASDFINGTDTETNAQLLLRLQEGLSCKALSNRVNMSAMIKEEHPEVITTSIIGYGDAEMSRDQHSILPVSFGGRTDWYMRTQPLPQQLGLTKTATLIQKLGDDRGIWQFSLGRDEAPGFYDILSIRPESTAEQTGTYVITTELRSYDLTNILGELTPDILTALEAAYSRYQTATIQFKDTDTSVAALTEGTSTNDYSVTARTMQNIDTIQATTGSRSHRNYAGDVLVKAAVPCFTQLSFTLEANPGAATPDTDAMATALAAYVNELGFSGRLTASALADIVHDYLDADITSSAIDMFGQIRQPGGTIVPLRSTEVLTVPDDPANMVTAQTVIFILDVADIAISTKVVRVPETF